MAGMIGLTNYQLKIVMNAARSIPVEKRDTFLQRIAAMLTVRGRGHFNDADVADITTLAIAGLIQQTARTPDNATDAPAATAGPMAGFLSIPIDCLPRCLPRSDFLASSEAQNIQEILEP